MKRPVLRQAAAVARARTSDLFAGRRRAGERCEQRAAALSELVDDLRARLDLVDHERKERVADLAGSVAALGARQTSTEESLARIARAVDAIHEGLAGLIEQRPSLDDMTRRIGELDRRVVSLQSETDRAGALAATAVAASEEIEALAPSLVELRRELLRLARNLQDQVGEPTAPMPSSVGVGDGAVTDEEPPVPPA